VNLIKLWSWWYNVSPLKAAKLWKPEHYCPLRKRDNCVDEMIFELLIIKKIATYSFVFNQFIIDT